MLGGTGCSGANCGFRAGRRGLVRKDAVVLTLTAGLIDRHATLDFDLGSWKVVR